MVDNSTQTGTDTIATDDVVTLNGAASSGVKVQRVKVTYGDDGTARDASALFPLPVGNTVQASGTLTASDAVVAAPAGDGTILSGASTAGSVVALALPSGVSAWLMLIKGYVSGAIYSEGSSNSTNGIDGDWVEIKGRRTGTAPGVESVAYTYVANGYYRGNDAGFTWIRARLIGGTGVTVQISASSGTGAVFLNSGLPGGGSTIGSVNLVSSQGSAAAVSGALTATAANTPGTQVTASSTGQIVASVIVSGNVTFHMVTSAFVGTIVFEGSVDNGFNYAPVIAAREDGTGSESVTAINTAAALIRTYTTGIPGFTHFRVRCSAFTSGTLAVYLTQGPFLIEPSPSLAAGNAVIGLTRESPSTAGTPVSNTVGVAAAQVLAANTARIGMMMVNSGATTVYLNFNGTAPTTAVYSWRLDPGDRYDVMVSCPSGQVQAIGSAAGGTLLVTELT